MDEKRLQEIEKDLADVESGFGCPSHGVLFDPDDIRALIAEVRRLRPECVTVTIAPGETAIVPGHGPVKNMGSATIYVRHE